MDKKTNFNEKDGMNTARNQSGYAGQDKKQQSQGQQYGPSTPNQKPCGCSDKQGEGIKDTMKSGMDKGIDKAKEYGSKVKETVKENVSDAAHKVKEVASETYDHIKVQVRR